MIQNGGILRARSRLVVSSWFWLGELITQALQFYTMQDHSLTGLNQVRPPRAHDHGCHGFANTTREELLLRE